jgi:hypothetical protein
MATPKPVFWRNPPQWYLNQLEGDAATLAKSKLGINRSDTELFNGFAHAYVSAVLSYHWGSALTKHMGDSREDGTFAAYSAWGQWGDKDPKGRYLYQDGFRDLYNNQIGRDVAEFIISNYGYIERSGLDLLGMIKEGVVQAYKGGRLITDLKNDPRVPQSIPRDPQTGRLLTPTEYFYGPSGPNRQSPELVPQTAGPQGYYLDNASGYVPSPNSSNPYGVLVQDYIDKPQPAGFGQSALNNFLNPGSGTFLGADVRAIGVLQQAGQSGRNALVPAQSPDADALNALLPRPAYFPGNALTF